MTGPVLLRLMGLAAGGASEFDGLYVKYYDPTWTPPHGAYDGGILEVTHDPKRAWHFDSAADAMELWRTAHGTREDGKPNRPLTAWTVEIVPMEQAVARAAVT